MKGRLSKMLGPSALASANERTQRSGVEECDCCGRSGRRQGQLDCGVYLPHHSLQPLLTSSTHVNTASNGQNSSQTCQARIVQV